MTKMEVLQTEIVRPEPWIGLGWKQAVIGISHEITQAVIDLKFHVKAIIWLVAQNNYEYMIRFRTMAFGYKGIAYIILIIMIFAACKPIFLSIQNSRSLTHQD